jgi:hypothetical protein
MYMVLDKKPGIGNTLRDLNLAAARPTAVGLSKCSFGVVK